MDYLYRVVPKKDWIEALSCGLVPRCPADRRKNRVHLNKLADVELVANLWFSAEEEPIVLEVHVSGLTEHLKWEASEEEPYGTWPNLHVEGIPVERVVRIFRLEKNIGDSGAGGFRLGEIINGLEAVFTGCAAGMSADLRDWEQN